MSQDNERFMFFLRKLTERLIIITQHNIAQKQDPCETDIMLLEELWTMRDNSSLPWVDHSDIVSEETTQTEMFADKTSSK